jgi:hypothetical protein
MFFFLFLVVANAGPWNEDLAPKIFITLGTAVVAALYGDDIMKRILPGKR